MRAQKRCITIFALTLTFLTVFPIISICQTAIDENSQEDKVVIRVGYPSSAFYKGFIDEVTAALKLWGNKLARKYEERGEVQVTVYDDYSSMGDDLKNRALDIVILGSLDYLIFEEMGVLEPVSIGGHGNTVLSTFILLTRADRGIQTLNQLEGTRVIVDYRAVGLIPGMWLDILLDKEGIPDKDVFFKEIENVEKASQAILPVFFGQAEACVVNLRAYNTMCELNPQLKKEMKIMSTSPGYLRGLTCIRYDLEPDLKQTTLEALHNMSDEPEGQQILMLLQVEDVAPFQEEYLKTIRELSKEHQAHRAALDENGSRRK